MRPATYHSQHALRELLRDALRSTPRRHRRGLHRHTLAFVLGAITALGTVEPTRAQTVRVPADFALPAEGPPPSGSRGASPEGIPLTDEGPAERTVEAVPDPVDLTPPPPPPPFEAVASPRHRDPRGRGRAPDIDPPRLRFLLANEFEPFNALDARGRPAGFHVELVRGMCAALDLLDRCQVQAMPWTALRGALARGEAEAIVAGIAVTAENREGLIFTDPYLRFPARFAARRGSAFDPAAPPDGARVGVVRGTAHAAMLAALFPSLTPVAQPDDEALRAALAGGRVDAAFADGARLAAWLAEAAGGCCTLVGGPYFSQHFLGQGLSVAARDPALAEALDWALDEMEATGRLEEVYLAAFPVGFY